MESTSSDNTNNVCPVVGRFAPSPSGRMHFGNITTALLSWLSARSQGGRWIVRIEDLDPQRSKPEHAARILDDLAWLGLGDYDAVYTQSERHELYDCALRRLEATGLTYPCFCTRADIMATQAPHQSDGRVVYAGTCRPAGFPAVQAASADRPHALRLYVPDEDITFTDTLCGPQRVNLTAHCGDFVLRRADGAWAYQLAVVVDDAMMGVTEVVRGNDLLLSSAQQIYLYRLLGYRVPQWIHVPLVCNAEGRRLSKRDQSLSMEALRAHFTPEEVIGRVAKATGLLSSYRPVSASELVEEFSWDLIRRSHTIVLPT